MCVGGTGYWDGKRGSLIRIGDAERSEGSSVDPEDTNAKTDKSEIQNEDCKIRWLAVGLEVREELGWPLFAESDAPTLSKWSLT